MEKRENKIKALVIDDELFGREQVKSLLKKYFPQITIVGETDNGKAAIQMIQMLQPDLVFLDIEMPSYNAFDILEAIPEPDFEIIFITAFDQYAIQAIKFSALDYLLKPLQREEFKIAVEKFLEKQKLHYDKKSIIKNLIQNTKTKDKELFQLAIHTTNVTHFVKPNEIIRCEADINYTRIFKINQEQLYTSKTLKAFDDLLTPYQFIRIHRSHLVNKQFIKAFSSEHKIILLDGTSLDISRRKLVEIKKMLE
jgi:two-component system, LytTR family, response regulator